MSSQVAARLQTLGLSVPAVVAPVASYVPAVRTGTLVFTAGQLPFVDGQLLVTGRLGAEVSVEQGADLARTCALNAIAALGTVLPDLDAVVRVVKVVGFVASTPDFFDQPTVVNGASDLLIAAFGEAGRHARSAVGMAVLPRNAPVEVELVVEVRT